MFVPMTKRGKFSSLSFLALVALLLNATSPFFVLTSLPQAFASQALSQSAAQGVASQFGGKILICTADGFRWVTWDELQNGEEQPEPQSHQHCILCFVAPLAVKASVIEDGTPVFYSINTQRVSYSAVDAVLSNQFHRRGFLSRAPPLSA